MRSCDGYGNGSGNVGKGERAFGGWGGVIDGVSRFNGGVGAGLVLHLLKLCLLLPDHLQEPILFKLWS